MTTDQTAPLAPRRLVATDQRRLPMVGIALGIAVAAVVLGIIETSLLATVTVAAMWAVVLAVVLAVLPIANTLTLDRNGFRIRSFGLFSRFVSWRDVVSIETTEGWAGSAVIIELTEGADRGLVLGLPRDPALGRRTFADGYGCDSGELAHLMESYRTADRPAATGP